MPKRIPEEIRRKIVDKAEEGLDGVQIAKHLEELHKAGKIDDIPPHLRTIQEIAKTVKPVDPSGSWRLMDSEPEDAALILPVLLEVFDYTGGRRQSLTKREAEIVCKIRRVVAPPSERRRSAWGDRLDGFETFKLAREYIRREDRAESTEDLDRIVAIAAIGFVPSPEEKEYIAKLEGDDNARTHPKEG